MEEYWIIQGDSERFARLGGCKDKILRMTSDERANLDGKRIFHCCDDSVVSFIKISVNEKGRLRYGVPAKA